jgi:hypothetical protein
MGASSFCLSFVRLRLHRRRPRYPTHKTEVVLGGGAAAQAALANVTITAFAALASAAAVNGFASTAPAAISAAAAAISAAGGRAYAVWAADAFRSALSIDATRIEENAAATVIASSLLSPNSPSASALWSARAALVLWQWMKETLHAADEDWDVWTIWYEDRLEGCVRGEERELAYVRTEDDRWRQGPATVNAESG